jgi:hypothetical protein
MATTVYARSEGQKFAGDTSLTVVSCATCHMTYAIPTSLYKSAIKYPGSRPNGWRLTCPLGHEWWYTGESIDQKLERERARAGRLAAERDQALARERGQRAAKTRAQNQLKRTKERVAAGVCPCCNRTFQNLARHMAGQHPDYRRHEESTDGQP